VLSVATLLALVLSGCGGVSQIKKSGDELPRRHDTAAELSGVPFYPQKRFQCGPAALAMMLQWSGVEVTPEELVPHVYIPAREGSLQAEILAAARRYGRMAYVLPQEFGAIVSEIKAGNPVLIMQDLSRVGSGRWHYAVVIGFDANSQRVTLRSGNRERHRMTLKRFERTWARGGFWAVVVSTPDVIPATAVEMAWLRTLLAFERVVGQDFSGAGWFAATDRWPDSMVAWIGLGNYHVGVGDYMAAVAAFEHLLTLRPEYPPALNNLAHVLAKMGIYDEAEILAERAVKGDGENVLYQQTLREIHQVRKLKEGGRKGVPVSGNDT
jgi:tetratricopeptide (TPR) repeat protein